MKNVFRTFVLAGALTLTPSCAAPKLENPVAAARTTNQRAYALIETYGALIEEATVLVRDPSVPAQAKHALGAAERVATPAVETLEAALAAYDRADADMRAINASDKTGAARAAATLAAAIQRLTQALAAAEAPIGELESLVHAAKP